MKRPKTAAPGWSGRWHKPELERILDGEPVAMQTGAIRQNSVPRRGSDARSRGAKGTIVAEFAAIRVVNVREEIAGEDVWLALRRDLGTKEHWARDRDGPVRQARNQAGDALGR